MFPKRKRSTLIFSKNQRCPKPVYVKGEAVERVDTCKYLGVVVDSKLNRKENINSVLKKVNSGMYCMRKLRSFGVNSDMLVTFYNAVICSIIMFCLLGWEYFKIREREVGKYCKKSRSCCGKAT